MEQRHEAQHMRLAIRLLRNTTANYLGSFFALLVAFFLTPFVINTLGNTRYGVWTLVGSVSGYLLLLDFGMASALAKYTAGYISRKDDETVNQLASTLFLAFVAVGVVSFLGIVWLSFSFARFFNVPAGYTQTAQVAVIILGLNFAIGLPLSVYNALTVGYQRYDILNVVIALGWLLNAGLTVLALTFHGDLIGLAVVACIVTVTKALSLRCALRRWVTPIRIRLSLIRKPLLKIMVSYSVFMFVMMACRQIEENTRAVIVGRLVGLDDVTVYSVGAKVSVLICHFAFPVTTALFPAFSELDALADRRRLGILLTQGLRASALVGMPIAGVAIILVQPLISFWVGPQHVASAGIGIAMILKVLVDQQLLAASSLLNGLGRLKLYTVLHLFAVLFSIGFSLLFAPGWGAIAVAIGSLLAWGIVLAATIPYTGRIAGVSLGDLLKKVLVKPLSASALTCLGLFGLYRWHPPETLLQLLLYGAAAAVIYLLLAWRYCLDSDERKAVVRSANRVLLKVGLLPAAKDRPLGKVQ